MVRNKYWKSFSFTISKIKLRNTILLLLYMFYTIYVGGIRGLIIEVVSFEKQCLSVQFNLKVKLDPWSFPILFKLAGNREGFSISQKYVWWETSMFSKIFIRPKKSSSGSFLQLIFSLMFSFWILNFWIMADEAEATFCRKSKKRQSKWKSMDRFLYILNNFEIRTYCVFLKSCSHLHWSFHEKQN